MSRDVPYLLQVSGFDGSAEADFPCWALADYSGHSRSAIVAWKHAHRAGVDRRIIALWSEALASLPWSHMRGKDTQPLGNGNGSEPNTNMHTIGVTDALFGAASAQVCVVSAPSRWYRRHEGRLVAQKLAIAVARYLNVPYIDALAVRKQGILDVCAAGSWQAATAGQKVGGSGYEVVGFRQRGKKRAHIVAQSSLSGRLVILVDDVVASGATLSGAARAVREAGGEVIAAFVLAHPCPMSRRNDWGEIEG